MWFNKKFVYLVMKVKNFQTMKHFVE